MDTSKETLIGKEWSAAVDPKRLRTATLLPPASQNTEVEGHGVPKIKSVICPRGHHVWIEVDADEYHVYECPSHPRHYFVL